jgi:murein DD-endopeptidase MepM/ murein hydrolase activator NlpD
VPDREPASTRSPPPPVPLSANPEAHAEPELVGVTHVVKKGETLYRIARTYGIEPRELMEANDIGDPRDLRVGMELFVPGALRSLEILPLPPGTVAEPAPLPPAPVNATLAWPVKGVLYSRFGIRSGRRHDGIDIAAPEGTAVTAAAAGTVIYTGEQAGYGSLVILRHGSGLVTLYAHASAVLVKSGQAVTAGTPIARVGHSGRTTGPHLHFEVREGTRPRNPLLYLR